MPNEREAAWQLNHGGWIYIAEDPERAGRALNTVLVEDLEGFLAGVAERGIEPGPVETLGDSPRQSIIVDGDGNRLKVAQLPRR